MNDPSEPEQHPGHTSLGDAGTVPASRAMAATGAPPQPGVPSTVMVVEDYAPLRVLCTRLLRRAGYDSVAAASADDAFSTLTTDAPPAIVVTDFNMPGQITGEAFIEHLRAQYPEVGLIVITGDTTTGVITAGTGEVVLIKPFANEALLDAVADVLAAKS